MIGRLFSPLKTRSYFLFGPRGTGKSTYLKSNFKSKDVLYLDLLSLELQEELLLTPSRFDDYLKESKKKIIIIDEIQKLPKLLDRVHHFISEKKHQFILTGSSARRLKQLGVNLLAGRASTYHLYPLSSLEIGEKFDLKKALEFGTLPDAYLSNKEEAREYLNSYVYTYIEKEIQQEQWVRKILPFRKFLQIAAQMNGKIINKSLIARDIGVDDMTVQSYFEILEDTLIGFFLPAYHQSIRKAQRQAPKFYFIDPGIKRAIEKNLTIPLVEQTSSFGDAFEHFLILELIKIADYKRLDWKFSFLQTKNNLEIDLVIERPGRPLCLVEIKSKKKISVSDAKTLISLGNDLDTNAKKYILSQDPLTQDLGDSIVAMHWQKALAPKSDFWSVK